MILPVRGLQHRPDARLEGSGRLGTVPALSPAALGVARHKRQPALEQGLVLRTTRMLGGRLSGDSRPCFFVSALFRIRYPLFRGRFSLFLTIQHANGLVLVEEVPATAG